jgi:DNA invertase Pin-like site-specific DNA recombinase
MVERMVGLSQTNVYKTPFRPIDRCPCFLNSRCNATGVLKLRRGSYRLRYVTAVALVGYARVSTTDQHPDAQTDALTAAGCAEIFTDYASGALARRTELDETLKYLRSGDTLIITKLDRLGRSVKNLKAIADRLDDAGVGLRVLDQGIDTSTPGGRLFFHLLAAMAEFEHDLIVERTHDGLAAARARGRTGGRKPKMTPTRIAQARAMYDAGELTVQEIAEAFGVTRPTIYRHLEPLA